MVSEITIFELHFEGAHFAPTAVGGDVAADELAAGNGDESDREAARAAGASGSRSRFGAHLLAIALVATVTALWWLLTREKTRSA